MPKDSLNKSGSFSLNSVSVENVDLDEKLLSDDEETGEDQDTKKKLGKEILIYSILLLVSAVGNSIFFKKMTNAMPNYPYFLSQASVVFYVPIFCGIVLFEMKFTKLITQEMTEFPKYKYFIMGSFDALSGICLLFGGVHTSGSTQGLLNNAVIPITMILSYVILGTRFKWTQYAGAFTLLMGVVISLLPSFTESDSKTDDEPLFNMIFLLGMVPQGLSSVYKEIAFGEIELDVNYLQAWIAIFQLAFGFLLVPLNTLSFLGDNAVSWDQLPSALSDGGRCFVGINSIMSDCGGKDQRHCDDCSGAWVPVVLYMLFNCSYNFFIMLVLKKASAALLYIVMTLRLPLVQVAFALSFVLDPPDKFSPFSIIGLVLILVGLGAYRYSSATKSDPEDEGIEDDLDDDDRNSIMVPTLGGLNVPMSGTVRRKRKGNLLRPRAPGRMRSDFFARIGIIESPRSGRSTLATSSYTMARGGTGTGPFRKLSDDQTTSTSPPMISGQSRNVSQKAADV